jgi:deoxyribodipyrimidine photo-lyase
MNPPTSLHWFRQDLRLSDNPAFTAAAKAGRVLPLFIMEDADAGERKRGAASRVWLHHSLSALNDALGGKLALYVGKAEEVIARILDAHPTIREVHWNRCYEPWRITRDVRIKEQLKTRGIDAHSHNGSLLWEPWDVLKQDGTPYRVFTPFYRNGCLSAPPPRAPLPIPSFTCAPQPPDAAPLETLELLPRIPWDKGMMSHWKVGEKAAQDRLHAFIENGLKGYKEGRNLPAAAHVSRLSPHLHFGEVSPNQVWYAAAHVAHEKGMEKDVDHFQSELGWREFSHSLLYHQPELHRRNLQARFDAFPWQEDAKALERWQRGQTGYPMVDAAMRELWQTSYMHNRTRMIVGSFLVKNLLLDWRAGERWFWDCLIDADAANNAASWQWIAGCGADAAPYFRIFNPVGQGEKFDAEGKYIRRFVPELRDLPEAHLFAPWEAPALVLRGAGVRLGDTYPHPMVDVKTSRERALAAFTSLKTP